MYTYCNICDKWIHQLIESTETEELCEKCFRYKPVNTMVDAGYYDNDIVIRACSDCVTLKGEY